MDAGRVIEIPEGGIWEFAGWEIRLDYPGDEYHCRCRHCVPGEGGTFVVPRLVRGENQAGFDSVGICLDCILEAARSLLGAGGTP